MWFKVDDRLAFHLKSIRAGNSAMGCWVRAGAWSSSPEVLTEGYIPPEIAAHLGSTEDWASLRRAGFVEEPSDGRQGHQLHDFLKYNPTAETVRAEREASRLRMEKMRGARRDADACYAVTSGEVRSLPIPIPIPDSEEKRSANIPGSASPPGGLVGGAMRKGVRQEVPGFSLAATTTPLAVSENVPACHGHVVAALGTVKPAERQPEAPAGAAEAKAPPNRIGFVMPDLPIAAPPAVAREALAALPSPSQPSPPRAAAPRTPRAIVVPQGQNDLFVAPERPPAKRAPSKPRAPKREPSDALPVRLAYVESFRFAYGADPPIGAADHTAIRRLVDAVGLAEAERLVRDVMAVDGVRKRFGSIRKIAADPAAVIAALGESDRESLTPEELAEARRLYARQPKHPISERCRSQNRAPTRNEFEALRVADHPRTGGQTYVAPSFTPKWPENHQPMAGLLNGGPDRPKAPVRST